MDGIDFTLVQTDTKKIISLPNLREFNCHGSFMQSPTKGEVPYECHEIITQPNLTALKINKLCLNKPGLMAITRSRTLKILRIQECEHEQKTICKYFSNAPILESLEEFSFSNWNDDLVSVILHAKKLKTLYMGYSYHKVKLPSIQLLASHVSLKKLSYNKQIPSNFAKVLLMSPNLESLDITLAPSYSTSDEISAITGNTTLTDLTLRSCKLDEQDIAALYGKNALTSLSLYNAKMSLSNWDLLKTKTSLTSLKLIECLTKEQIERMIWIVTECKHIQDLHVIPVAIGVRYRNE
jgi:hypothetical protein